MSDPLSPERETEIRKWLDEDPWFSNGHIVRELLAAIDRLRERVVDLEPDIEGMHAFAVRTCPHVRYDDEGTQWCTLAESPCVHVSTGDDDVLALVAEIDRLRAQSEGLIETVRAEIAQVHGLDTDLPFARALLAACDRAEGAS